MTDMTDMTDFSVYPHTCARAHTYERYPKKASDPSDPSCRVSDDLKEAEAIRYLERLERARNRKKRER